MKLTNLLQDFCIKLLLKALTKIMNVDRDKPIYILFIGDDTIEINQSNQTVIKYQFK